MPIYEYRCENGHSFEVLQSMSDEPVAICETCGAPVERVLHPVAVHFKGSGFYTTDYAKRDGKRGAGDGANDSSSSESKKDKKEKGEKKSSGEKKAKSGSEK
jgi:putative FmdB family regulatory protein